MELRAPAGTTVGDIAELVHAAAGVAGGSASEPIGAGHSGERPGLWIGSRALPAQADLERVGLHSGCILGVGGPTPRGRGPHAAVRLHVVSGPDSGRVEPIGRGRLRIGRDAQCQLRLSDPDVSRQHAEITVTPSGVSVRDLGSTNGTLILSAGTGLTVVDRVSRELALDSYLTLGETTLCVAGVRTPLAATHSGEDGRIVVNRPPRLDAAPPTHLELPPDRAPERRAALPWIAALIPALGGMGLAWFLHSPQFLAFALLSPLVLLATTVGERVGDRRQRGRTRVTAHRQRVAATAARSALADAETAFRRRAHPDPAALLVTATTPDTRLWERRRADPDFLDVRLGLGAAPARAVTRVGTDVLTPAVLPGVPAVMSLRTGAVGICGPRPLALPLTHWIVGQLAVLHSPADLQLAVLLSDGTDTDWEWLRWLPHARSSTGALRIARTSQDRQRLVGELSARMDAPVSAAPRSVGESGWTVVLVDRCVDVTETGALVGDRHRARTACITFVYLDVAAHRLPAACAAIAQLSGETGSRVHIRRRDEDEPAPPGGNSSIPPVWSASSGCVPQVIPLEHPVADRVSAYWCDEVSRALAPLTDPGADQANDLPVSVRARDLYDLPDLTPATIRATWDQARGRATTPVGIGLDGRVEIDLGRDGPHALIAGTTGAGKSELLQALVAGLALHSPPGELQFVLIDYKGGAAFGECARLPHTVGMVTDLDGNLTERALRSLEAELHRREALFARTGATDLDTYRRSPHYARESVGRMVLVVDEFASLAEELPDFVTGLVGIAQRGRSLGVHLVLATQRPSGVVSAEIRANTALRIALRVTDQNDSSDVIGSALAAHIDKSLPGRAVVRAAQSLFSVQVGRISTTVAEVSSGIEVIPLDRWGAPLTTRASRANARRTDLQVVVDAVRAAWAVDPVRPRRPWLNPLPAVLDVALLATAPPDADATVAPARASTAVVLGLVDRPRQQDQVPFLLDLADPGAMLFVGGPRSGRTSALRTAAVCAAGQLSVDELHIHAIDCSGGGLRALNELPHCGAVVGQDAPASMTALLGRLSRELDRRRHRAAGIPDGDTYGPEPALLLLVDGWEGFLSAVEDLDAGRTVDTFLRVLRDGAAAGLTVLITGDRAALAARLSSAVQRRLVLRLSDPADYAVAGLSRQQVPAAMPPGRAVDSADGSEIQLAIFGADPSPQAQLEAVRRLVADAAERERREPSLRLPFAIRALPARVGLDELADLTARATTAPGTVVLGVGGDSGERLVIRTGAELPHGAGVRFLVAGPARSGRSTLLRSIMIQLSRMQRAVVAAGGPRSPLIASARDHRIATIGPEPGPGVALIELERHLAAGRPMTLLIDDTELFGDTPVGDRLTALMQRSPAGLDVFATGRGDDLALAFSGVAAEVKRARTGVLLQPGPGDGELFGLRLPYVRSTAPPGRGLLIAPDLMPDATGPGPLPLQVAHP